MKRNLEQELIDYQKVKDKCRSDNEYAQKLYAALCNIQWYTDDPKDPWSCSWRYAGGLVSNLICSGDYMDFYCSGNEGKVDPEIEDDLGALGWSWQHWPDD